MTVEHVLTGEIKHQQYFKLYLIHYVGADIFLRVPRVNCCISGETCWEELLSMTTVNSSKQQILSSLSQAQVCLFPHHKPASSPWQNQTCSEEVSVMMADVDTQLFFTQCVCNLIFKPL